MLLCYTSVEIFDMGYSAKARKLRAFFKQELYPAKFLNCVSLLESVFLYKNMAPIFQAFEVTSTQNHQINKQESAKMKSQQIFI